MTAVDDVAAERARQDAKWGEQNHPDGTGRLAKPLRTLGVIGYADVSHFADEYAFDLARAAQAATDWNARKGRVTWADILLEEVFEALAEDDPATLRTELVQVAAVAQQWVEAIDRSTNTQEARA